MSQSQFNDTVYLSLREFRKIPNNTIVHWEKVGEWKIEVYKKTITFFLDDEEKTKMSKNEK